MRKVFLLFALLSVFSVASAQKINYDQTKDNLRLIATDGVICRNFKDKIVLKAALEATVVESRNEVTLYFAPSLTCATQCEVAKGAKMLIKLFDDSVFEFTATIGSKQMVRDVHNVNGFVFSDYTCRPSFRMSKNELEQIISKGVKKIRIEMTPENYESEFKKDKIGKALGERLPLLEKTISTKKSFSDGF